LLLFLAFFLRPEHHKIHDDENENERHKKPDTAGGAGWSGTLCLSQENVEHIAGIGERTLNPIATAAISSLPVVVEARVLTRKSNFPAEDSRRYTVATSASRVL
jgi:hypothetical protein